VVDDKPRIARLAVESDFETPTITQIYHVDRKDVVQNNDPFRVPAEDAKTLDGVNPNLRRRVTNELKKYNRSADGKIESKQLTDEQIFTGYDAFGVVEPPQNLETFTKIYELSAPHYSAINAKVANIVSLGYKFVETNITKRALEDASPSKADKVRKNLEIHRDELTDALEAMNEEDSFTETLEKVWRDYEVTGNGYIEIGRKKDNTIGYIGHVPSHTIRVRRKRDGYVQINGGRAVFFRNFADTIANPIGSDTRPNELIHIKRYSPSSQYYGIPDVVAAQQAIAGNEFSSQFNLDYFENKAVPRHVITLKGANLEADSIAELLTFFETGLKGQGNNHRSLFIPLPADSPNGEKVEFKIETIEQGEQDASFNNYRKSNLGEILMAHRVPITKVSSAEGVALAAAKDADKTFKEQVCQPQQSMLEKKVNRIIKEMTDAYELVFNEMALTDTNTQSQIDERMVKNGIWTPNEPRLRDGMSALPNGHEPVDLNAKDKIAAQAAENRAQGTRQRDSVRSANQTDSQASSTGRNPKGEGRTTS
jgi:PBSX family phage portal protein